MGNAGGVPDTDSSALREWEAKHTQQLEEIAAKEAADKRARREKAAEELAKFSEDRNAQARRNLKNQGLQLCSLAPMHGRWWLHSSTQTPVQRMSHQTHLACDLSLSSPRRPPR